ncbi:MAG TPA: hypothetical protein VFA07_15550 [Chthonomonadaceae bacterium]|nr:hypothetical protein [Chthonomonadaceae bacterium]
MQSKGFLLALAALVLFALVGCGGGSSSSSGSSKASTRQRLIATTRVFRDVYAMAGLARRGTSTSSSKATSRASSRTVSRRVAFLLSALHGTRGVQQGLDPDTSLTYRLTVNSDGSGREDLFTDSTYRTPAGAFIWGPPQWSNGKPNTYPAVFHVTYNITAGNFAGTSGTMDVTLKDASGLNCLIHLALKDLQNDTATCVFTIVAGVADCTDTCTLGDGATYTEQDQTDDNGDIQSNVDFSDGWQEDMSTNTDGTTDETLTDSSGDTEASGDCQSDGSDTIDYSDGSSEDVNVDTSSEN